jgi:dGTPase
MASRPAVFILSAGAGTVLTVSRTSWAGSNDAFQRRTRGRREQHEAEQLAPAATLASKSRGRAEPEEPDEYRTAFEQDRDRIVHSKAFRRLKQKTQVFMDPHDDHFVTRLTHALQVTQIGRAMAAGLGLNETLAEAICLGHDIGHSPFGHTGEVALTPYVEDEWLHSGQGVRIATVLEPMNLSWEVLDGIRAHSWKIPEPPATPEGMICRFADRVAYIPHDVSDAIRAGVIQESDLPAQAWPILGSDMSAWIGTMVEAVIDESNRVGQVAMTPEVLAVMTEVRTFMFERVYLRPQDEPARDRAIRVIRELVDHYTAHPDEIPDSYRVDTAPELTQAIDYVAGMTDRFALRAHHDLVG